MNNREAVEGNRPDDASSSGESNANIPIAILARPATPPSESDYEPVSDVPTEATMGEPYRPMMYGPETMLMDLENGEIPEATRNFLYTEGRPYYRAPEEWVYAGERYVDEFPKKRYVQDVTALHLPPMCVLVDETSDHEFYYDDHFNVTKVRIPSFALY